MLSQARAIALGVASGTLAPDEPTHEALSAAEERNGRLRALRTIDRDAALAAAQRLGQRLHQGAQNLPLAGVPVALKDNVAQAGHANDAGRRGGYGHSERLDALIAERLTRAGAIIVGRANMDELAYGVTGTNRHTGQVLNPWNETRHPGGSSAGSAAAVASSMASLAVGTDTVGSVRIPAALCGLVGLRPTPQLLPTAGIAPLARSFDTPGPLGHDVADVSLLLSVLSDRSPIARATFDGDFRWGDLRVLALTGKFAVPVHAGVSCAFAAAVDMLARLGARVSEGTMEELAEAPRASGPVIGAEAAFAWKAELADHPESFSETVAGHLHKGAALTAIRYLQAQAECRHIAGAIHDALDQVDLLALPTTASAATPVDDPGPQLDFLALTVPFSISGNPALSLPMGLVDGLPVGLQLVARPGADMLLLRAAHELERELAWRERRFPS